jgi:hypothetical protein
MGGGQVDLDLVILERDEGSRTSQGSCEPELEGMYRLVSGGRFWGTPRTAGGRDKEMGAKVGSVM